MDLLLAYGRKIRQSTDLESERNLRVKRERMEISLQFAKLAVNVLNAKFIYIAGGDVCFYFWRSHRRAIAPKYSVPVFSLADCALENQFSTQENWM